MIVDQEAKENISAEIAAENYTFPAPPRFLAT